MITLKIPKNNKGIELDKEIALVNNIKDQENRKATLAGLTAIRRYI
jgi:hypothetical protein